MLTPQRRITRAACDVSARNFLGARRPLPMGEVCSAGSGSGVARPRARRPRATRRLDREPGMIMGQLAHGARSSVGRCSLNDAPAPPQVAAAREEAQLVRSSLTSGESPWLDSPTRFRMTRTFSATPTCRRRVRPTAVPGRRARRLHSLLSRHAQRSTISRPDGPQRRRFSETLGAPNGLGPRSTHRAGRSDGA